MDSSLCDDTEGLKTRINSWINSLINTYKETVICLIFAVIFYLVWAFGAIGDGLKALVIVLIIALALGAIVTFYWRFQRQPQCLIKKSLKKRMGKMTADD